MSSLCGWVIPKCSSFLSVFIFYLDEKCADFHSVSGQIELWRIVHDLRSWFHTQLLPAVSCFWPLQMRLSVRRGVVGHPWSPCCACEAPVMGAIVSIWHWGSNRYVYCPKTQKGKMAEPGFGARSTWGSTLTKFSSLSQVFPAWIPWIPRHLNQQQHSGGSGYPQTIFKSSEIFVKIHETGHFLQHLHWIKSFKGRVNDVGKPCVWSLVVRIQGPLLCIFTQKTNAQCQVPLTLYSIRWGRTT